MNLKTETSQPFVPLSLFGGNGPAFTLQLNVNGAATVEQKLDVASATLHALDLGLRALGFREADALHPDLERDVVLAKVDNDGRLNVFLKPRRCGIIPRVTSKERYRRCWVL